MSDKKSSNFLTCVEYGDTELTPKVLQAEVESAYIPIKPSFPYKVMKREAYGGGLK